MEEDRFEVIDQDAYEAVNAKERTRITSFDDASFYYVDGSLTEAVIAGKKRQIRKLAQKQPVRRSPALECAIALSTKGLTEFMIRTIPEVTDLVRMSAIYEGRNQPLLQRYMENHPDPKEGARELRTYLRWLAKRKKQGGQIKRSFYVLQKYMHTENFAFFKMFERYMGPETTSIIVQDIQGKLIGYLDRIIDYKRNRKLKIPRSKLGWGHVEEWNLEDVENHVSYFMNLVCRYGPYDVTDRVEEFMEQGVFTLDLIRQRSGMKKNFAAIHQYMAQVSKEDPRKRIMLGKWMKRLMRYAVPDKLREETDPITEWLIQRNDWKLIKYAIKQKYIGKKNADALLKYTVFSGREDTDPRIIDLLVAQKNAQ